MEDLTAVVPCPQCHIQVIRVRSGHRHLGACEYMVWKNGWTNCMRKELWTGKIYFLGDVCKEISPPLSILSYREFCPTNFHPSRHIWSGLVTLPASQASWIRVGCPCNALPSCRDCVLADPGWPHVWWAWVWQVESRLHTKLKWHSCFPRQPRKQHHLVHTWLMWAASGTVHHWCQVIGYLGQDKLPSFKFFQWAD